MKRAFFFLGVATVAVGAGATLILPELPGSVQSNETLAPVGTYLINNGNWIALIGLLLILIAAFIG